MINFIEYDILNIAQAFLNLTLVATPTMKMVARTGASRLENFFYFALKLERG